MSSIVQSKNGKKIVLLNPAEKSKRYARQLKNNCFTETGLVLTEKQRSYRSGYLAARQDNADAYNSIYAPNRLKLSKAKRRARKADYLKRKKF